MKTAIEIASEQSLEAFENVKKLFMQQIIDAWKNGYNHGACVNEDANKYHGIQYYTSTFSTTNKETLK